LPHYELRHYAAGYQPRRHYAAAEPVITVIRIIGFLCRWLTLLPLLSHYAIIAIIFHFRFHILLRFAV
jgi:hypothetical protein